MNFLRKYQRLFFAIITVVIIASFTFFGTYSVTQNTRGREDRVIGKTVDGHPMSQNEVKLLSHFLSLEGVGETGYSNIFNDGVITHDFLQTGLAQVLAKEYFPKIQTQMQTAFEKSKKWSFYSHPQVPFLSAKEIWKKLLPSAVEKMDNLANENDLTVCNLNDYLDLQLHSRSLPSDYVKQVLLHQQSQLPWITPDQRLVYEDLSLYGFHSVSDWMGSDFLDLVSQFIINSSCVASQKGYSVAYEEAKQDLYRNAYKQLERIRADNSSPTSKRELFDMHLRYLGMDEKSAVGLWQKVLLFRKFMTDVSQNVFVDSLAVADFTTYVQKKAKVDQYSLSKGLELKDFTQLMAFQSYIKAIGPYLANDQEYLCSLPQTFYSLEEIEKTNPTLVEKCYEVSYKKVMLDSIGVRISEKELWSWQLDDSNWELLKKEFSSLSELPHLNRNDRFESLEAMSSALREKLDDFSRRQMLKTLHENWIIEELKQAPATQTVLHLRSKGGRIGLEGINDIASFAALLESENEAQDQLQCYTQDKKHFYTIELIKKAPQKRVISFEEGMKDGTVMNLLDDLLETQYSVLRNKNPSDWKDEKGNWLSLYDSRDKIGKHLYKDLLSALSSEKDSLNSYAHNRFNHYLDVQREALISGQSESSLVSQNDNALADDYFADAPNYVFKDQWKLTKNRISVDRSFKEKHVRDRAFAMTENEWSNTLTTEGLACFIFVKGFEQSDDNLTEEIAKSKNSLSAEAVCEVAKTLINEIQEKSSIVLPVYVDKLEDEND